MEWKMIKYNDNYIEKKSKEFKTSSITTKLLLNRDIISKEEVQQFLYFDLESLENPFLFEDMNKVTDRLEKSLKSNEKIVVFGDYDVDGVSGVSFLVMALRELNFNVSYYIPSRAHSEKLIDKKVIKYLKKKNANLLITVDTNLSSEEEFDVLEKNNIDVIITDHHKPTNMDTSKILTINPKVSTKYTFKSLSGAGVAFKLACAVYDRLNVSKEFLYSILELVTIGTIADVVPMVEENRIIIKRGLLNLKNTQIKGIRYLINYLKLDKKNISASDVGFFIAPMLNALGRIEKSKVVVDFFLENDDYKIYSIIEEMKRANKIRRYLEINMYKEIESEIKKIKDLKYIFMKSKKWHSGVLGVVSSRLSLKFNVPVVLVSIKGDYAKASCRSVEGLNIFNILKEISDKFERFGGHDLAAGFLAETKLLDEIEQKLKEKLKSKGRETIEKNLNIDSIFPIENLDANVLNEINRLSPFGLDNPEPIFLDTKVKLIDAKTFGVDKRHFKGEIEKHGKKIDFVAYNLSEKIDLQKRDIYVNIVYTPILKTEDKKKANKNRIELKIRDFKYIGGSND